MRCKSAGPRTFWLSAAARQEHMDSTQRDVFPRAENTCRSPADFQAFSRPRMAVRSFCRSFFQPDGVQALIGGMTDSPAPPFVRGAALHLRTAICTGNVHHRVPVVCRWHKGRYYMQSAIILCVQHRMVAFFYALFLAFRASFSSWFLRFAQTCSVLSCKAHGFCAILPLRSQIVDLSRKRI